jgi:hypothetical protein
MSKTYYCYKCKKRHSKFSDTGKEHKKYEVTLPKKRHYHLL